MAITEISVCNSALIKLGAARISSFSDDSQEARLCNEQYEKIRDAALKSHLWNFAIRRVVLNKLTTTPAFGFSNEFQLPVDCLKVIHMEDRDVPFKIEGRKLLTDNAESKILYISKITDTSLWDVEFAEYLAHKIAAELAYPLVQSVSLATQMNRLADLVLKDVRSSDAQEGTPDDLISDVWLDSRL